MGSHKAKATRKQKKKKDFLGACARLSNSIEMNGHEILGARFCPLGGVEGEGRDEGAAAEVRPGRPFRVHFCANACPPDQR